VTVQGVGSALAIAANPRLIAASTQADVRRLITCESLDV
jgi:hypothetical protein